MSMRSWTPLNAGERPPAPVRPVRGTIDGPMTTPTMTPTAPPSPNPIARVQTHGCARCGAPVALDVGLCERCNPLGLRDSSSSQVHGTVFVGVVVAIVGLALAARLAVAGIGPFQAVVAGMTEDAGALVVDVRLTNSGSAAGTTSCRVSDPALQGAGTPVFFVSPRIAPKETVTVAQRLVGFSGPARPLDVECSSP
jgi:hypothetical protein